MTSAQPPSHPAPAEEAADWPAGCLSPALLEGLARGGAAPEGAAAEHLAACAGCRTFLDEARRNAALIDELSSRGCSSRQTAAPMRPAASATLPRVPGFEFIGEIGRGGQGVVYEAMQEAPRRRVAIKMLAPGVLGSAKQRLRLEREAEITASLRHPGIAAVHQTLHLPDGGLAIVMELVDGGPLDGWSRRLGTPVPINRRTARPHVALIAEVCAAVAHAHQRGVIHRDLKPGNILVDAEGRPRVVDFGIARHGLRDAAGDPLRTLTGGFAGTIEYCSPEQVSGDPDHIDTRTDVYTLGVILYELLAGRLPYDLDGPPSKVISTIALAPPVRPGPPPPRQGIDDELWTILVKALAKDRERRYRGVGSFGDDLLRYLAGQTIEAKRESGLYVFKKWARRRWIPLGALLLALLALAAATVVFASQAQRLRHQRTELRAALAESMVGRGRLLGRSGGTHEAEKQLLAVLAAEASPQTNLLQAAFSGPPAPRPALWALAEIAVRQPCIAAAPSGPAQDPRVHLAATDDTVGLLRSDGEFVRYSCPSLRPIDRRRLGIGNESVILFVLSQDLASACFITADEIRLFDTSTGETVARADSRSLLRVAALVLDRSGRRVLCWTDSGLWVWEPTRSTDAQPRPVVGEASGAQSACFDPLSDDIYALGPAGVIRANADTGTIEARIALPPTLHDALARESVAPALAVSDSGHRLCVSCRVESCAIDPRQSAGEWVRLPPHQAGSVRVAIDAAGGIGMSRAGIDPGVRVLDVASGTMLREITTPFTCPPALTPDGKTMITLSDSGLLRAWATVDDLWRRPLTPSGLTANSVAFRRDARALVTGGEDGRVLAWRFEDGRALPWDPAGAPDRGSLLAWHAGVVGCVAFADGGTRVASIGYDGKYRVSRCDDDSSDEPPAQPPGPPQVKVTTLSQLAVDPLGRFIACAGVSPSVELCSPESGARLQSIPAGDPRVRSITISPDGLWLAWSSRDTIVVRDVASGATRTLRGHDLTVVSLAFNRDGSILATAGNDQRVLLWRTSDWTLLRELAPVQDTLWSLGFHPGGAVIAGGGRGGIVHFWEISDGRQLASIPARPVLVLQLAWSPVGDYLAVAGGNSQPAELWDFAELFRLVEVLRDFPIGAAAR